MGQGPGIGYYPEREIERRQDGTRPPVPDMKLTDSRNGRLKLK